MRILTVLQRTEEPPLGSAITRTYLVDDHSLVRDAVHNLLDSQPDFEVVGQSQSAAEALPHIKRLQPDVIVMDLLMPGMGGMEAAFRILSDNPRCRVVIASSHVEPEEVQKLLEVGVSGFVSKNSPARELLRALRSAVRGEVALCPEVMTALAHGMRQSRTRGVSLTSRQLEVLLRLARGLTTREVAADLCLSPKTVEKHRAEIFRTLDARNLVAALRRARELNLLGD